MIIILKAKVGCHNNIVARVVLSSSSSSSRKGNKKENKNKKSEKKSGQEEIDELRQLLALVGYGPERLAEGWRRLHGDLHRSYG